MCAGFRTSDKEEEFECPKCGNKWTVSGNKKTEKREVPNWKEFFDDDKVARNIREIFRNTRGPTVPGAHFGKVIGIDEANFVLFQTYSIVKYILSRFEEKSFI